MLLTWIVHIHFTAFILQLFGIIGIFRIGSITPYKFFLRNHLIEWTEQFLIRRIF